MTDAITRIRRRLAEIEAREKAATPGPWRGFAGAIQLGDRKLIGVNGPDCVSASESKNSEFIAASRSDIPALRKALEESVRQIYKYCACPVCSDQNDPGECIALTKIAHALCGNGEGLEIIVDKDMPPNEAHLVSGKNKVVIKNLITDAECGDVEGE